MDRRTFVQKSSILMAGLGTSGIIHPAIRKAFSIAPEKNSTYLDAEHVIVLMQENRSFDHAFGSLKGVRGFLDKKTFKKADGKSVFFQRNQQGKYAIPTRMDIMKTKATWMSSLPHSWSDQIAAWNKGKYDQWLTAKASGKEYYQEMPLTLGFYNREDLPFYYQLADAFSISDQYFSSALAGTTPNRLFHWAGTLRQEKLGSAKANVYNENIDYDKNNQATWKTFPEILETNKVSWNIYQNEISLPKGMSAEQESWLANFTDNPLEWFQQYHVRFSPGYWQYIPTLIEKLKTQVKEEPENKSELENIIKSLEEDLTLYHPDNFSKLSSYEQNLHNKAFCRNDTDPDFWELEESVDDHGRRLVIPKGDVLYKFRKDVKEKKLPTVSWLIAPEHFSDHPSSPWYGAWYISEVLNILTENPEVWKKTILIINYDENDGYFDHVLPFTPPNNPSQSVSINGESGSEFVNQAQAYMSIESLRDKDRIEGPVGLGYRVPLIIASPWTRGGYVNSEVCDHTSVIQFLEHYLEHKFKKDFKLDNISHWRRSVCGDLTSFFNHSDAEVPDLDYLNQKSFTSQINSAKDQPVPEFQWYDDDQLHEDLLDIQEHGIRKSNALPYHFTVNYKDGEIHMANYSKVGVPLLIYDRKKLTTDADYYFPYALYERQQLTHKVESDFDVEIFGPNGFYRNFKGKAKPTLDVRLLNDEEGRVVLLFEKKTEAPISVELTDLYKDKTLTINIKHPEEKLEVQTPSNSGWYDIKIKCMNNEWYYAGRSENGKTSISDPHWA